MSEDFRQAVRALIASPLMGSETESLAGVRGHRQELERFFGEELGYRLEASQPGLARLAKVPGPGHQPRGLTRGTKRFTARRYALVCLVLAAAETAGERTTANRLFQEVAARAGAIEGFAFSTETATDRRAFIQAVRAVQGMGVLELAEGEEERFARAEEGADALYRVDRDRLALIPTTSLPPSLYSSPDEMPADRYPETEEGRLRRRRHRVTQALVEEPVVYLEDLEQDEIDYLNSQRPRLERLLREKVGLTLEVRAEGWVTVDEDQELSDISWPEYSTHHAAALRICDELRRRRLAGAGSVWPEDEVAGFVAELADEYEGYWRQDAQTPAGTALLTAEAIDLLEALRLVERQQDGIAARHGAGRFASTAALDPPAPAVQEEL